MSVHHDAEEVFRNAMKDALVGAMKKNPSVRASIEGLLQQLDKVDIAREYKAAAQATAPASEAVHETKEDLEGVASSLKDRTAQATAALHEAAQKQTEELQEVAERAKHSSAAQAASTLSGTTQDRAADLGGAASAAKEHAEQAASSAAGTAQHRMEDLGHLMGSMTGYAAQVASSIRDAFMGTASMAASSWTDTTSSDYEGDFQNVAHAVKEFATRTAPGASLSLDDKESMIEEMALTHDAGLDEEDFISDLGRVTESIQIGAAKMAEAVDKAAHFVYKTLHHSKQNTHGADHDADHGSPEAAHAKNGKPTTHGAHAKSEF